MLESVFVKTNSGLTKTDLKNTRWSEGVKNGSYKPLYPRPQMVRNSFLSLNGMWDYAITKTEEMPRSFAGEIRVPFSPESVLSGVERQLRPNEFLWYRKDFDLPKVDENYKYLLHFGAVDQRCTIYINGEERFKHIGGYLPFFVSLYPEDVKTTISVVLKVTDKSETSFHARGKQKLKRGGMFYTAQSGIWQDVWIEKVPSDYVTYVKITPDCENSAVKVSVDIPDRCDQNSQISVIVREDTKADIKSRDSGELTEYSGDIISQGICKPNEEISLTIPDFIAWTPENPYLYHLTVTMGNDRVEMYFAMREVSLGVDREGFPCPMLNKKPCPQSGLLDQGYWPDGLYTAPCDEALIYDIQTAKELGYNMIRKHIKIEPERWYYHCDRLGMLVWQDMVCGGSKLKQWFVTYLATVFNTYHISVSDGFGFRHLLSRAHKDGRKEFELEVRRTIYDLYNHPSIILWVPFNEGWGQFDALRIANNVKAYDPTRLVDHASGWFDQKGGDVVSRHYYFFKLHYKPEKVRFLALTEYGGYTLKVEGHSFAKGLYGYGACENKEALCAKFKKLMDNNILPSRKGGIYAFVYTQLSDIEDEVNGIMTYDREIIKFDENLLRACNKELTDVY